MDSLKFPLEFTSSGFKKLKDGSQDYYAQLLSIIIRTEPQTHPLSPRLGVYDPSFKRIDKSSFILNASKYVPEVTIETINTNYDERSGDIKVSFTFSVKE